MQHRKYHTALIYVLDEHFLTPEQRTVIPMLAVGPSVTRIEAWREPDGAMGLSMTDDGAIQTAYFDRDGVIIGDWIC